MVEIIDPNIESMAYLVMQGEGEDNQHNRIEVKIRTSEG